MISVEGSVTLHLIVGWRCHWPQPSSCSSHFQSINQMLLQKSFPLLNLKPQFLLKIDQTLKISSGKYLFLPQVVQKVKHVICNQSYFINFFGSFRWSLSRRLEDISTSFIKLKCQLLQHFFVVFPVCKYNNCYLSSSPLNNCFTPNASKVGSAKSN